MKIFTCGPVAMYPGVASVRSKGITYFRTPEYALLVKRCLKTLSSYIGNDVDESMIYMACSGTGAMEAAVENSTTARDKALVINGGTFGHRFCELLQYHNIEFESVSLKWDEKLEAKHLEPFEGKNYTILFVNHNETSSGQLYDLNLLSSFCKKNGMMLVVDAISSFLSDELNMKRTGIDLLIFSSQKGLCCSPGCSFISVSERMKDKMLNKERKNTTSYFDLRDYFLNMKRGQTPYTPAVMVIYEICSMIEQIEQTGGLNKWLTNIADKASYFRNKAKQIGYTVPSYPISNMLTPLSLKNIPADYIAEKLKTYGFMVSPCGGDLAKKIFRVCHLGATTKFDADLLLDALLEIKEGIK